MNHTTVHNACRALQTCFIVCCLLVALSPGHAQIKAVKLKHLDIKDGLSENNVECIYQDNKGYIWIGTRDGLNKYNGYEFTHYRHSPKDSGSIGGNSINTIYEDKRNNLWIGLDQGGLALYHRETETFTNFSTKDYPGLPSNWVSDVLEDSNGTLWVATYSGIARFNRETETFTTTLSTTQDSGKPRLNTAIQSLYEDNQNRLFACSRNGLNIYDREQQQWETFDKPDSLGVKNTLCEEFIQAENGNYWLITANKGSFRFNPSFTSVQSFEDHTGKNKPLKKEGWCAMEDGNHNMWIGNINGGAAIYKPKTNSFTHYSFTNHGQGHLTAPSVSAIFRDRQGNLWFGTHGQGVFLHSKYKKPFYHYSYSENQKGLRHPIVSCFLEDRNHNVWIGTDGGGLHRFNPETGNFKVYNKQDGLRSNVILDIEQKQAGELYVVTWDAGIYRFNTKEESFTKLPRPPEVTDHNLKGALSVSDSSLWVPAHSEQGGYIFNPLQREFYTSSGKPYRIPLSEIQWGIDAIKDRHGNVWIISSQGLFKYNPGEDTTRRFWHSPGDSTGLSSNYAQSLFEDSRGRIWAGTSQGLDLYLPEQQRFKNISGNYPDMPDNIKGILEDGKGNLWMSSNKGIVKFRYEEGTVEIYNASDGLQANQFTERAALKAHNGRLYFGGPKGFNVFHPDSLVKNPHPPELVLTDFMLSNKSQKKRKGVDHPALKKQGSAEKITLNYNQDYITFEFAALDFTQPGSNQYAYKMQGYDNSWHYVGNKHSATYTNLGHGSYTFLVKATNNDGIWNEDPYAIKMVIEPPLWKTNAAYIFYGLIVVGLFFTYRHYTLTRERLKSELRVQKLESRKEQELSLMRLRYFTNFSHELRTPLTLILSPIEHLILYDAQLSPARRQEKYQLIHQNTRRMLRLVNQLLSMRKSSGNEEDAWGYAREDLVALLQDMREAFRFIAEKRSIELELETDFNSLYLFFDRNNLESILYNLVSNAFKFTPGNGRICIRLQAFDTENQPLQPGAEERLNHIKLEVEDTGGGIPEDILPRIFDRHYSGDSPEEQKTESSGIGLAITKELVEMYDGDIDVATTQGEGTAFKITFPVDQDAIGSKSARDTSSAQQRLPGSSEALMDSLADWENPDESKPILMVVEDDVELRMLLMDELAADFRLVDAADGDQALAKINKTLPDMIVSDISMEPVSGWDLCREIKSNIHTSHIPVILLTAYSGEENQIQSLELGADDYINKPFNSRYLKTRIHNLLENRQRLRERFQKDAYLQTDNLAANPEDQKLLVSLRDTILENITDTGLNAEKLSKEVGLSRTALYKKVKELTGQSVNEFIRTIRLKKSVSLLSQGQTPTEVAYEVGFNSYSYFARSFQRHFGQSPKDYTEQNSSQSNN